MHLVHIQEYIDINFWCACCQGVLGPMQVQPHRQSGHLSCRFTTSSKQTCRVAWCAAPGTQGARGIEELPDQLASSVWRHAVG